MSKKIIFVFGASGAGKTTSVIPNVAKELSNPKILEIDDIKRELPDEFSAKKKNELKNAIFFLNLKNLMGNNENIIISYPAIMLNPKKIISIYKSAKSSGYETEAAFLSVDYKRAQQGVDYRYVQALKGVDTGEILRRLKPWKNKILHYLLPLTMRILKESRNVDKVRLFDRNGTELSDAKIKTFFSEQNREYSESEQKEFQIKYDEISDFIKKNKELFYKKLYR